VSGCTDHDVLIVRSRPVRFLSVKIDHRVGLDGNLRKRGVPSAYPEAYPVLIKFIVRSEHVGYHPVQTLERR